jgi:putative transposase
MNPSQLAYFRHRFPAEIISHCVWLYFRFSLSFRDIEEMMAKRGMVLTYETVREWCSKFGGAYAKRMRSRSPRSGDRWHLDEVFLKIQGRLQYLWRAVDQDGEVLDILVQPRRNKRAAKRFFRKLLKDLQYVPRAIITDKLGSYAAAKAEVLPSVEHRTAKWLNNRAENSHQPTRERERRMRGFKSPGHAQRFLSVFGVIASFFRPSRHLLAAVNYREIMRRRFTQWRELISLQTAI